MEKPLLIHGLIGNGRMLATLDRRGEVHHLYWPDIDRNQQVGRTLLGIYLVGRREETLWLSGSSFEHYQEYQGDTAILRTSGTDREAGMAFVMTDFCVPGRSLLVRRLRLVNQGSGVPRVILIHYAALDLEGSELLNACYYHAGAAAIVHYRQHTVCAIGLNRAVTGYTCGRERTEGAAFWDALDGHLEGKGIELGDVDGALAADLGALGPGEAVEVDVFWSWAAGREQALASLEEGRRVGAGALAADTGRFWEQWLAQGATHPCGEDLVDRLFRRSLVTIKLLSDAEHGGIIAAPETDPAFVGSGGYGYCWGRDAAWVSTALAEAGHYEESAAFYRWAQAAQEPDGSWYQRYYCDGSLAPSWGLIQGDETASVVFGVFHHFILTRNRPFLHAMWPMVRRAAEYLRRTLDPETGLPGPSIDLWEERLLESAYTAAAVFGAFTGAAYLAREVGDEAEAAVLQTEADHLRTILPDRLWAPGEGRFLRGLYRRIGRGEYLHRRACGEAVCEVHDGGLYGTYAELYDRGLDSSILGLAIPFGVLPPRDPRLQATAAQIAAYLGNPRVGGIHRYSGDCYRGGNPWLVCTLWLGWYELACGQKERAWERLEWAIAHRTALGLLPEQVNAETGAPFWVVPLSWSHALFVHLVLAFGRRGLLKAPAAVLNLSGADHR